MSETSTRRRRPGTASSLLGRDALWLSLSILVGGGIVGAYLATHAHPAYEGGLFLEIVERIRANGFALPTTIPQYTTDGVPFAYPPLVFYVVASLVELTGIDPVTLTLVLPGVVTVAALVPTYLTARELLGSVQRAGIATVLFAGTPAALRWHISAGGIVRAPAFLFTMAGLYLGVRLFRDGERRLAVPAAVLFGLTVLTHPHYTAFFGLSYLVLFAALDRSLLGLATGAAVAAAGFVLAAPWWVQVAAAHGPDVFTAAAGTHRGLGGGFERFELLFWYPVQAMDAATPFYLLAFLGAGYLLWHRRYLLPGWLFLATYVIGKSRFLFVPGAMAAAVLLVDGVASTRGRLSVSAEHVPAVRVLVALTVVVAAATVGGLYAGSALDIAHQDSSTQPQTVDPADERAMSWARQATAPTATFTVVGDSAEWFPYLADRTSTVSPWGTEWTTTERYYHEFDQFSRLSTCDSASCLERHLANEDPQSDYVYLPRGEYTVRGKEHVMDPNMRDSLRETPRFDLAYQNEGVMVFRVTDRS